MRIVHFAPFAPHACGLYEAARDMCVADKLYGHETYMVDTGVRKGDEHVPGKAGKKDSRGDNEIITAKPEVVMNADIIIAHTGISDNWIVKCQAPIIMILHGRPAACFRPEQFGKRASYSLVAELAKWPRMRAMVTFWPYHVQYWKPIIPDYKLVCFPAPPIDERRFSSAGEKNDYSIMGGKWNVAIAESWREDIDIYEITNGAIEYARHNNKDVKFHIYGMDYPLKNCWVYIKEELRRLNAKGEFWARRTHIDLIYRAADLLLSPHKITTRSIGEALSCGTPVIAAHGCEYATYTMDPTEPQSVAKAIETAINDLENDKQSVEKKVQEAARNFSLILYSERMNKLYERIKQ